MRTTGLFFLLVFSCAIDVSAQKNITEAGMGFGVSMPVIKQRNLDFDRPSAGAMLGLTIDFVRPMWVERWYYSFGLQAYGYYFSNSPLKDKSGRAIKLFGYSFGAPLRLHKLFHEDEQFAFRVGGGIIPILETSALVRTDVPDGGLRFNVAPEASFGILLNRHATIGFRWFMPLLLYGSRADGDTFHLQNFTFNVSYCLRGRHFGKSK